LTDALALLRWGDAGWGDEMALAAFVTLAVALCAFSTSLVFGTLSAAAKLSGFRPAMWAAEGYTAFVRGIPDLLVIYLFFFGGSMALRWVARMFGYDGYIELPAFAIGTLAIGLVSGAYAGEVIRGAFEAVPKGQLEAARACGMSGLLLFARIQAPLALRYALPGLGNVWQVTLKETSLISVIGLTEIMRQAAVASGSTQQPFTFYFVALLLYLGLTLLSNKGFAAAENYASRGVRRA
jgi:octopine/nopaline transport system permease protein